MTANSTQWYLNHKIIEPWAYICTLFSPEECQQIIDLGLGLPRHSATVSGEQQVDQLYRKNSVAWLDSSNSRDAWIFQRVTAAVQQINQRFWDFDLDYLECLQFTIYDQHLDRYRRHIDLLYQGLHYRKLTFTIQLSDPQQYQGCDLWIEPGSEEKAAPRDQGCMIAFPSWTTHRVSELEQGVRYSLVGWACGARFR
jgi:PKHD-type hydroxylase